MINHTDPSYEHVHTLDLDTRKAAYLNTYLYEASYLTAKTKLIVRHFLVAVDKKKKNYYILFDIVTNWPFTVRLGDKYEFK